MTPKLVPDHANKRFEIQIATRASKAEIQAAEQGTVRGGNLVYELDGKTYLTPIMTLRGDYRDAEGNIANDLRCWEKRDFKPRPNDIFQEGLYCIQWITRESLNRSRKETFFATVTDEDLERESRVESLVARNLARWQEEGLVPEMKIEPGGPPRYQGKSLIINLGWQYWHHLFNPRKLVTGSLLRKYGTSPGSMVFIARLLNRSSKLCMWEGPSGYESTQAMYLRTKHSMVLITGVLEVGVFLKTCWFQGLTISGV